jgi:hypothetical protein
MVSIENETGLGIASKVETFYLTYNIRELASSLSHLNECPSAQLFQSHQKRGIERHR